MALRAGPSLLHELRRNMRDLSKVLGAIAHPSRRAIIARLVEGPARVTQIAGPFRMSLSAVSKHLKVLEGAGLVRRHKRGRDHIIELCAAPLRQVSGWVHQLARATGRPAGAAHGAETDAGGRMVSQGSGVYASGGRRP